MKSIIIFACVFCVCYGHSYFRGFFPNGFRIPNPCAGASGKLWEGVGHTNAAGGGQLNPFGQVNTQTKINTIFFLPRVT